MQIHGDPTCKTTPPFFPAKILCPLGFGHFGIGIARPLSFLMSRRVSLPSEVSARHSRPRPAKSPTSSPSVLRPTRHGLSNGHFVVLAQRPTSDHRRPAVLVHGSTGIRQMERIMAAGPGQPPLTVLHTCAFAEQAPGDQFQRSTTLAGAV